MKLAVVSHKECWRDTSSPSGYSTHGGFPLQMAALSEAFDETVLVVPLASRPAPAGLLPLTGHRLAVRPLPAVPGSRLERRLRLLRAMPGVVAAIRSAVDEADAVHAVVPGDIGMVGLITALARKRPLFVRHCGLWGSRRTLAEHALMELLERAAGGTTVVMATGGGLAPPSARNPAIQWIFSTTLRESELREIRVATPWRPGVPLRLVTVGRLDRGKNVGSTLDAIAMLRGELPDLRFTVVGDGPCAEDLRAQARRLDIVDRVEMLGQLDHERVLAVLAASHAFVLPTLGEGFPKAVLEAMACGLPVIATAVSVIPQLLYGERGILVADPGPTAVAAAIRDLVASAPRLETMGRAARAASGEFTLERWRDLIGERCTVAWRTPTRQPAGNAR